MPFVLDHTNPDTGANYPDSFWVLAYSAISHTGRTATLIFHGYIDQAARDSGMLPFEAKVFTFNDPSVFEYYFATVTEQGTGNSFDVDMENIILFTDTFFTTATHYSVVRPRSAEIGNNGNARLEVTFTQGLFAQVDPWDDGVTIKVNGSARTIVAADQNPFEATELRFDLSGFVVPGDVITWEYDSTTGHYRDLNGASLSLMSCAPIRVVNNTAPVLASAAIVAHSHIGAVAKMTFGATARVRGVSAIAAAGLVTP